MKELTYEQLVALFAETREQLAASDRMITKTGVQIKELEKNSAQTDKQIKALAKQVAEVTDTLGRYAEEQVRPKLLELFREQGIFLEETHQRVVVEKDGQYIAEIDLLLVNTIYSVVVEVKNTLRQADIDGHIERLQKLQTTPSRSIKSTMMYGAVAGMIVSKEVERYAIKQGLYVIKPKGENVQIANGAGFVPQVWKILG